MVYRGALIDDFLRIVPHLQIQHRDALIDDFLGIAITTFFVSIIIVTLTLIEWDDSGIDR